MRIRKLPAVLGVAALLPLGLTLASPASAAAGCQVAYAVTNQWQGGFGASVAVTNLGDPVTSWTLGWSFPAGQTVTQLWNGVVSQSGAAVTVRNAGYNGSLATGASASFGFNGAWTGSNPVPTAFTLNGVACTGGVTTPAPTTPAPSTPPPSTPPPSTPPPAGGPVKVMALGDSITGSPGCWRAVLWQRLQQAGLASSVDFVGTLPPQGCGFTYDGENEGHGGFLATNIAEQNQLVGWLAAADPDVVMMHLGTNDVWNNRAPATILAAFTKLVGQMRAANPAMRILVAQIIPMTPANCAECTQRVVALNAAIPAWAAATSTAASPVTVVDQFTGFTTSTDTGDGVHPNAAGDQKIANRWYPALTAALS